MDSGGRTVMDSGGGWWAASGGQGGPPPSLWQSMAISNLQSAIFSLACTSYLIRRTALYAAARCLDQVLHSLAQSCPTPPVCNVPSGLAVVAPNLIPPTAYRVRPSATQLLRLPFSPRPRRQRPVPRTTIPALLYPDILVPGALGRHSILYKGLIPSTHPFSCSFLTLS